MSMTDLTMYQACLLHASADRNLRGMVSKHLERFAITRMEWLLLSAVSEAGHTGIRMTSLAQLLNVSLPQITALTNGLLEAHRVEQRIDPKDRRSRSLYATKKGRQLIEQVEQSMRGAMREWLADIPRAQLEIYMRTIQQLASDTHAT